jgi:ribonuclease HI
MHLTIYTDGGARGNPGPSAIGVVILDQNGQEIKAIKELVGIGTNNQAEYKALQKGLTEAHVLGAEELSCFLDSELVVKQLTGLYKIKEPGLQLLAADILRLTKQFKKIEFKHVRRNKNARADELVNQALDEEEAKNNPNKI